MVDGAFLLKAMNGIHEEQVLLAGAFLEAGESAPPRRLGKRWIVVLAAAVLLSLFTVTAYALGWFGIGQRTFAGFRGTELFLSLNGYRDSPEYKANAEWTAFYHAYVENTEIDYDSGFLDGQSADTVETCHYYGCADQTMADRLFEIAGRYGLKLHTLRLTPVTLEDFYQGAGTGAFLSSGGTGNGYIYEDGSFKIEGDFAPENGGDRPLYGFTFQRHLAGTVLPLFDAAFDPEDYTEWEYTNVWGDRVLISFNEKERAGEIFFDRDGVYLNVSGGLTAGGDSPESLERLADLFIFHEALPHEADIAYLSHGPTVCDRPGDAASLADFLSSPEGKGAAAYYAFAYRQVGEAASWGYDPWAQPQEALLEEMRRLAEDYGLHAPSQSGTPEAPDWLDQTALEQFSPIRAVYDNGVLDGDLWQVIPKGALSISLGPLPEADAWESWYYRTDKGYVVYIQANLDSPHGPDRGAVILYEGENAWFVGRPGWYNTAYEIEATANGLDFSLFK